MEKSSPKIDTSWLDSPVAKSPASTDGQTKKPVVTQLSLGVEGSGKNECGGITRLTNEEWAHRSAIGEHMLLDDWYSMPEGKRPRVTYKGYLVTSITPYKTGFYVLEYAFKKYVVEGFRAVEIFDKGGKDEHD